MHKSPTPVSSSAQDARIVRTHSALRSAMLALLERKPLDQITIRDITSEAGVHYTTFFRHHATKEALLDHVAADQIDSLVQRTVPIQDAADTEAAFLELCHFIGERRALWTALLTGGAADAMRAELLRASHNLTPHRARHVDWIPISLSVICSVTVIAETLAWWLKQPQDAVSPHELARMLSYLTIATSRSSPERSPRAGSRPRAGGA